MTLYFEEEGEARLPIECEKIARQVIETTLEIMPDVRMSGKSAFC